ncbi:Ancient ubiquitous protein 1 [Chamberlinius hualienensis]
MISASIEDLFNNERLPGGFSLFPVILYFPLGIVLATLRVFIGFHAFLVACLLPKSAVVRSYILRVMCFVLGILVSEEVNKNKNKLGKIIVANHVTVLDHLAIDLVLPCTFPCVWDLPQLIIWCLGYKDLGINQGRETFMQNVQRHCRESNLPILVHPEEATTNGTVGLLKFSTWPFCVNCPISPVIIQVKRLAFLNISPSVLGSRWWSDLFWFIFSPCTIFTVRYLPDMKYDIETSVEDFTKQVQETMSNALKIQATNYTAADKTEYLKKVAFSSAKVVKTSTSSERNSQLLTMIHQVKEVLPNVPVDVIKSDLMQTNSVSLTISNLLEGIVHYVPEVDTITQPSPLPVSKASSSTTQSSPSITKANLSVLLNQNLPTLNMAASTFGKNANERMQSYLERKQKLIENARTRYLAKQVSS